MKQIFNKPLIGASLEVAVAQPPKLMIEFILTNDVKRFKILFFSGLLRPLRFALSPRNDGCVYRHCEGVSPKQSRNSSISKHYIFFNLQ